MESSLLRFIEHSFDIVFIGEIQWDSKAYASNLSRFYGTKLPRRSFKERHCGKGPFLLIIVIDTHPKYESCQTSRGPEQVNVNVFSTKQKLRELTGGGHRIHATNTQHEFEHDIALLTGHSSTDFLALPPNDKTASLKSTLPGYHDWDSLKHLFYILNRTTDYVLLRAPHLFESFEINPDHPDIDLLVRKRDEAKFILNAKKTDFWPYRARYEVMVSGTLIHFDLREPGDGYYDTKWQLSMLANRIFHGNGYLPCPTDYVFSLLYHALIHKREIPDDYHAIFTEYFGKHVASNEMYLYNELKAFFTKHEYDISIPRDYTVGFNQRFARPIPFWHSRKIYGFIQRALDLF